jgi:hypothetical protein
MLIQRHSYLGSIINANPEQLMDSLQTVTDTAHSMYKSVICPRIMMSASMTTFLAGYNIPKHT